MFSFKNIIKQLLGRRNVRFLVTMRSTINAQKSYLFNKRKKANTNYKVNQFGDPEKHTFFGYYDLNPFNKDETKILAIKIPSVKHSGECQVGYFDLCSSTPTDFKIVGTSLARCWQQGCRLQWHPNFQDHIIIYNDYDSNKKKFCTVFQDISSKKKIGILPLPIYSLSKDGSFGLSLNFSRLQRLRPGYGYSNIFDKTQGILQPKDDGILIVNLKTKATHLLFSINDIASFKPEESMHGAEHYFNHIEFSPDSKRFLFFHIWIKNNKRRTRLLTCDVDGKKLYDLINHGNVSHYTWKSSNEIIAFVINENGSKHYYCYSDQTRKKSIIGEKSLNEDGHPSISPDGTTLLTDTYPDNVREQHLLLYSFITGQLSQIGSFYVHFKYQGETRCDLHPRWSPSGKQICFDSTHNGLRSLYILKLSQ